MRLIRPRFGALGIPALIGGGVAVAAVGAAASATAALAGKGLQHAHGERAEGGQAVSTTNDGYLEGAPGAQDPVGVAPTARRRHVRMPDGVSLYVEESGPEFAPLTVLFVHGYTLNLRSFYQQRQALCREFTDQVRVLAFDIRSHGRSDRAPTESCTLDQVAADLDELISQLVPTGRIVLVGHSMGGMALMALADRNPKLFRALGASERDYRVSSVALINTSSGNLRTVTFGMPLALVKIGAPVIPLALRGAARRAEWVEWTRSVTGDLTWMITKRLSFGSAHVPAPIVALVNSMISATRVEVMAAFYGSLLTHDGTRGLANLAGCDVLVVGAERDAMTPLAHAHALATALPRAQLVIVPGAGHLVMLEQPESVNRPLLDLVHRALTAAS